MLAVTFDIDWAPDWTIALCAQICARAGVKATFFVTHATDIQADLKRDASVEIGLHPNFLPNSSHGRDVPSVMEHLLELVPDARSMRAHALMQASPLLFHIVRHTAIETDVSLLLPLHPGLMPTELYFEGVERPLIRLPYYWEDDVIANWPDWSWDAIPEAPNGELRIYDFHPIHVALNMADDSAYQRLKAHLNGRPMQSLTEAECAPFVNPGGGTRSFLERLVASAPPSRFHRISDITDRYRGR